MNSKVMALILFFISSLSLSAQTAAELDALLVAETVSVAAAARFVLDAVELLPPGLSGNAAESAAYDLALAKGWVKAPASSDITLKETAFLIMGAFGFKGGLLYSLLRNPRYAYREMIYRRIIQGRADPAMTISGQRLLRIIGRALNYSGEEERLDELLSAGAIH